MTIQLRSYRGGALVEVLVNRKHSEWFVFDTGAEKTLISDAAARRCGLRPLVALARQHLFRFGKGIIEVRPAMIDDLRLSNGAFSARNLLAYVLPDSEFEGDYTGILGMDVISQMGVFSLNASCLRFHRTPLVMRSLARIPATVRISKCLFSLQLGSGQPIQFLWDTGASTNYLSPNIPPSRLRQRGGKCTTIPVEGLRVHQVQEDGTEEEVMMRRQELWLFSKAQLGTIPLQPLPVYRYSNILGWPGQHYGVLGFPILTEYEITADFVRGRVFTRRYRWNLAGTYGVALFAEESRGGLRWFLGSRIPSDGSIPEMPRTAELLAVDGVPVGSWETIRLIQRLMFPQARQSCSVECFDGRRTFTTVLRAVGVPYFGLPLFYFHGIYLPKAIFKFEGGYLQSRIFLEVPKELKGVRGARRRLRVDYRDYSWHFAY
jgi:predicted aspartyl protease